MATDRTYYQHDHFQLSDTESLICVTTEVPGMVGESITIEAYYIIQFKASKSGFIYSENPHKIKPLTHKQTYELYKTFCKTASKREKIAFWRFIYNITPKGKNQLFEQQHADAVSRIK